MNSSRAAADSYLRSIDTEVQAQIQVDGCPAVVLQQTCFYPEGGGQPFDTGTIAGVPVLAVQAHATGEIVHTLAQSLPAGTLRVTASIDWVRRFDHMQQHSGQHILSQSFLQVAGAATAGFHLSAQRVTIDLAHAAFSPEQLAQVEQLANHIVQSNLPVHVSFPGPAELAALQLRKVPEVDAPLRVVSIGNFDRTACAGTHVAYSAEVALIKIIKVERSKSGQRVEFCCGQRALEDYQRKHATLSRAAAALSCAPGDVDGLLAQQLAAQQQLAKQLRAARDELLQHECALLLSQADSSSGRRVVCRAWNARAPEELRELARLLAVQPGVVALLGCAGEQARVVLACAADLALDMRPLLTGLLQQLGGERGGGQQRLAQGGGFKAAESALQAALDAVAAALPPAEGTRS